MQTHVKSSHSKNRKWKILFSILAILLVIRLILPYVVLHYANKSLAAMPGYYGHIDDIDLAIYRGAYQVNDMFLNKKDSVTNKQTDFFKVKNVDLSVEWKSLFDGKIVGELTVETPVLIFTKDKTEIKDVKKDTADFRNIIDNFMPLKINRFEIHNGDIHYADNTSKPKVDVALKDLHVLALNFSNAKDSAVLLPSVLTAEANVYQGTFNLKMKLNPLAKSPTFDLNADLKNTNLVLLNDFLKAYGNFDVNKGTFGLYSEIAAKQGKFTGYVKPLIKDLDVLGPEDKKDNFFHKVYEGIVGTVGVIFKNQSKDQVATKVTLNGDFKDPKTDTWSAIFEVLRNAFIQALVPSIDNQINITSVDKEIKKDDRNFFQRIFNKKDKDKDSDNNKKKR